MKYPKKKWKKRKYKNKKYLIKKCLTLWSKAVKLDGVCALCGSKQFVESHHIVRKSTRMHIGWFMLENGIPLCYKCHYNGIHSIHFPTTKEYQYRIDKYLERKSLSYEKIYNECNGLQNINIGILEKCIENIQKYIDNKNI